MKTEHYGDYLVKLTRMMFFNCYLVQEEDSLTVVDTGLSGSADGILAAAEELGKPITRIALTHAHIDHVGSLDALRAALPDAEVLISGREARFLSGDMSLDDDEPQDKLRGGFPDVHTEPTGHLNPGDKVGSLEVVAAPGHTPGHIAFLDTRDRTLIAGDAFATVGPVTVSGRFRWRFPFPALATWHKPTALETARSLRELSPARLAVGHGKVIEDPISAMDEAIRDAAQRWE